jgi:circadian clock protein KaiC
MKSTPRDAHPIARVPSGVPGLDGHIGGGFPAGRTVLVAGGIGTGKTTLSVQFLVAGADRGEIGVLITADEKPRHVIADARRFGWSLDEGDYVNRITVLDASPYFTAMRGARKPDANVTAAELTRQVRQLRATNLVIDGAASLLPGGADDRNSARFLAVLISALEDEQLCTAVLTAPSPTPAEQFTAGAIELGAGLRDGRARRSLTVRSMAGVKTPVGDLPLDIVDGQGVVVRQEKI